MLSRTHIVQNTCRGGESIRPFPALWEAQAGGGRLGKSVEGPRHPLTPKPRGVDPCQRSAAHPTRPCLTSRRCSPDKNALGWLPGPGRGWRRVIKGPGEMGGASGSERSQSGGVKAGTDRVAGLTPRRQGAAEGCAAGEEKCAGGGGRAVSRRAPGRTSWSAHTRDSHSRVRPGVLVPPLVGTQV